MNLLSIESFIWTPHIETSIEVCIHKAKTQKVGLCILLFDNLDDPDLENTWFGLLGRANKIRQIKKILSGTGVALISPPRLTKNEIASAVEFSKTNVRSFRELLALEFQGATLGFGVGSSLVDKIRQEVPMIEDCEKAGLRAYLLNAALVFLATDKLIKKYSPETVVTFNGRFANARAISLAGKKNNITILYHEITDCQDKYRLADKTPHDFSWWRASIVEHWEKREDKQKADEIAINYFEKRQKGIFSENIDHTRFMKKGFLPNIQDKYRVVFFSQSDEEYSAVDGLTHPLFQDQRACISWLIEYYEKRPDVQFFLRITPNLISKSKTDYDWWHSLTGKNLFLIPASSPVDSYSLIKKVDLVITYCNASVGNEATYLGRPSVVLGDSVSMSIDAAYYPSSISNLIGLLGKKHLEPKPKSNVFPYGYYRETYGIPFDIYVPTTRYSGKIDGLELQNYPSLYYNLLGGYRKARRFLHKLRVPFC